jgi:hypothetical protein
MLEFIVGRLREEPFGIAIRAVSNITVPIKLKRISDDNSLFCCRRLILIANDPRSTFKF